MKLLAKWFSLSLKDKLLVFEVVILLIFGKFCVWTLPFRKIMRFLGESQMESSFEQSELNRRECRKIRDYIRAIAKYFPWKSKCFDKAIAGKIMLDWRKIPSTVYFGVAKSKTKTMDAHAWLRYGNFFVTGGEEQARFVVLAYYS
ncbi:MAG: hypothetical protein ACI85I_002557 [Arenicella sp.]|jgi:hypothetical protein